MKEILFGNLFCALALCFFFSVGCAEDDTENDDEQETEVDLNCLGQVCVNDDGNTHDDCSCDAQYCVPDVTGSEYLGVTPLTCTVKDCDLDDETTCPDGYKCVEVPDFVIEMLLDDDIIMPKFLCGI